MPNFPHDQPTEATDDGDFARQLATLLGPAYQAGDDSNNAAEFLALGGALADVRNVILDSLREAFATEAWDLLSELETIYGLPVRTDLAEEDRQARLVAKIRAARAGTPQGILRAVAPYDTTAQVFEVGPSDVTQEADLPTAPGAARGVYQWALQIASAVYDDPTKLAAILAIVEQMKPAHTRGSVCVTVGFRFDDPDSLFDRDVFGV